MTSFCTGIAGAIPYRRAADVPLPATLHVQLWPLVTLISITASCRKSDSLQHKKGSSAGQQDQTIYAEHISLVVQLGCPAQAALVALFKQLM